MPASPLAPLAPPGWRRGPLVRSARPRSPAPPPLRRRRAPAGGLVSGHHETQLAHAALGGHQKSVTPPGLNRRRASRPTDWFAVCAALFACLPATPPSAPGSPCAPGFGPVHQVKRHRHPLALPWPGLRRARHLGQQASPAAFGRSTTAIVRVSGAVAACGPLPNWLCTRHAHNPGPGSVSHSATISHNFSSQQSGAKNDCCLALSRALILEHWQRPVSTFRTPDLLPPCHQTAPPRTPTTHPGDRIPPEGHPYTIQFFNLLHSVVFGFYCKKVLDNRSNACYDSVMTRPGHNGQPSHGGDGVDYSVPSTRPAILYHCSKCYRNHYITGEHNGLCVDCGSSLAPMTGAHIARFTWYPAYKFCPRCGMIVFGRATNRSHERLCTNRDLEPLPKEACQCPIGEA